jgi:hypothetical protein
VFVFDIVEVLLCSLKKKYFVCQNNKIMFSLVLNVRVAATEAEINWTVVMNQFVRY